MTNFRSGPAAALLKDGKRLHLQHGPIDLIIEADGDRQEVAGAYRQAARAFEGVLEGLVAELPLLREPCRRGGAMPEGTVARRMHEAASAHLPLFVTPMIAVAGAVADHVLEAMVAGRRLRRSYVNNGGDIALYLGPGARFDIAICTNVETGESRGRIALAAGDPVRGIATSGWRGRSHSLGIADAVTVLARTGATADAAATLIANAVNVDCAAIERRPARELSPDSDLGETPVTVKVGALSADAIGAAMDAGEQAAAAMVRAELIQGALIALRGEIRITGAMATEVGHSGPSRFASVKSERANA